MFIKTVEFLAYSGTIAALLATSLAIFTISFINSGLNYVLLLLIFSGTLTIYNIDHLRDLNYDEATNPLRVNFIKSRKRLIYLVTILSVIIAIISVCFIGLEITPILMAPFVLGLLHRRLKGNPLFTAIYITISWLIVTVYLPAYLANRLPDILLFSSLIGVILFCNAYTSSLRQKSFAVKHVRYLILLSIVTLVFILVLGGSYMCILPVSLFTTVALFNFRDYENFEIIYFDGLQLSGSVMSILFLKLITI